MCRSYDNLCHIRLGRMSLRIRFNITLCVFVDQLAFEGVSIDSINEYIYTAVFKKMLYRAKLDGSSLEAILAEGKRLKFACDNIICK